MKYFYFCILFLWPFLGFAQTAEYDLYQIVALAKEQSLSALQAENRRENRYWQYRNFLSNYKPQLRLSGTLPDFNRTIDPIPQPDGTFEFRSRSVSSSDVELQLDQSWAFTGGQFFISSQLQRIDILSGAREGVTYAANPFSIGFSQPIFAFNPLKWEQKIEPIRFEESKKQYVEQMEEVSMRATNLFFNLLIAQISYEIAVKNRANNDTIYKIAEGRFSLGKIAENELLQLELNLVNSQQQMASARLEMESTSLNLNSFIGNPSNESIRLIPPSQIPDFEVDANLAVEQAKLNRQQYLAFKRLKLEAERDVAQARGDNGLNINLFARFGLTQQSENLRELYNNPQDQERLRIGFTIPVIDWGRQEAAIKTAMANQELVNNTVAQDEINFEQEIYVLARRMPILREQLIASKRAEEVSQKSYDIAQNRFLVGKLSITDLNIALQQKDQAARNYLQALRDFWTAYYELRMLTLFDFEKNEIIGGE